MESAAASAARYGELLLIMVSEQLQVKKPKGGGQLARAKGFQVRVRTRKL